MHCITYLLISFLTCFGLKMAYEVRLNHGGELTNKYINVVQQVGIDSL